MQGHGTGVMIVGAQRTPIGALGGQLSSLSASDLGGAAIASALAQSRLPASAVDACHMGHVLSAGTGQAPARQAATAGGLGENVVTSSLNKVCAAGMAALILGCMEVRCVCCGQLPRGA
jgi:acetyl-CoA C-acetyltransferase